MSSPSIPPAAADTGDAGREEMRRRHGVRALSGEEEGTSIAKLPAGVYGFAYAPGQPEVPIFAKRDYHSFEVHKAADGTEYLIGFVTQNEASDLAVEREGAAIRLFPEPWEAAQSLVRVPAEKIVAPKRMPREAGNPFPFRMA